MSKPSSLHDDHVGALADALLVLRRLLASRQVHRALVSAVGLEVSQQELQVLAAVGDGAISSSQLASVARMDPGAVSRQVSTLVDGGLIERIDDPDRRSAVLLRATPSGREAIDKVAEVQRRHLYETLVGWSTDDVAALAELLPKFITDLQQTPY